MIYTKMMLLNTVIKIDKKKYSFNINRTVAEVYFTDSG